MSRVTRMSLLRASTAALTFAAFTATGIATVAAAGSPGPGAHLCVPDPLPAPVKGADPIFPPGQYPVKLPAKSLLGAPNDLPDPYAPAEDWGNLPNGRVWGSSASVTLGPDGNIWVMDRCGNSGGAGGTDICGGKSADVDPIIELTPDGTFIKSFGHGVLVSPHKAEIDKDGNVWVADNGANVIYKFDSNGKILMTIGTKGVTGTGDYQFDAPTDVAIGKNGDIFVADGHSGGGTASGNARIMKYDKDGHFLMKWGQKGMGPGEFDVPHTLAIDKEGRLYVGDRQNNRVQIFDQNGKFLKVWYQFSRPSGMYIDKNDMLYVIDSESRDGRTNIGRLGLAPTGYGFNAGAGRGIRIGSVKDGKVKYYIPDDCSYPYSAGSQLGEGVTTDRAGNVYAADVRGDVRIFAKPK
jgi:NHL repeat